MNIKRKDNTYAMDVWVKKDEAVKRPNDFAMEVNRTLSFSRQGIRK